MLKKVLITGVAGFIGFHTSLEMAKRGDIVVGYDNFNDYYDPKLKRQRANLLKQAGIEVIEGDLCNSKKMQELIGQFKITHIVHLAAQAGVRYSLLNPQAYIQSNIEGFVNILETCRANRHLKLVYASSSSVYGLNTKVPFSEQDKTDSQASLYGVTKKSNELMAATYHHLYKIPVTGLRFFTVYGPWGRPDMAYYSFSKAIIEDKVIDVYNHGKLQRDFTYIDDIVDGIIAAVDLESACEIFNLGNHQPVELMRFIEIIEQSLSKKAKMRMLPMQSGDVLVTYADIEHSRSKLGFVPKISLEIGIPKFIEWLKNHNY
jgi:UDP-glucuronate 4-epimerase